MTRLEQIGAAVVQDPQAGIVQAVRLVPGGGIIFYASVLGNSATATACATRWAEERRRLITILWAHLRAMEDPLWKRPNFSHSDALPIQILHDMLGRPHLLLGEHRGPAISFSTTSKAVWAALCGDEADIGIDVAGRAEFQAGYPVRRVFHVQELHQALELAGGDLAQAAALLWSIKEAVAKALGCAFHLVDPRDIHVSWLSGNGAPAVSVSLSGKALARFPMADHQHISVRSLPQAEAWLSIAALHWPQHRIAGA